MEEREMKSISRLRPFLLPDFLACGRTGRQARAVLVILDKVLAVGIDALDQWHCGLLHGICGRNNSALKIHEMQLTEGLG